MRTYQELVDQKALVNFHVVSLSLSDSGGRNVPGVRQVKIIYLLGGQINDPSSG